MLALELGRINGTAVGGTLPRYIDKPLRPDQELLSAAMRRAALLADEQSRAGRELEKARRRDQALATAAHELKTPLGIITGYIELLLSEKPGPLNERQRRILGESQASCTRLQHFVQSFLTFSALETGKTTMQFQVGDLNQCLAEVYHFWLERFQAKQVAFYYFGDERLKPLVFDYHKVQHAVSNLIENALKFTPGGGTVWLTTEPFIWERRVHQQPRVPQDRRRHAANSTNSVRVTVSDTGPGISPEYHQEVFDDFFRLPHDKTEGSGLGLAIARRLIQAHSGKIWVESAPGAGSKFSFLLPAQAS